MEVASLYRSIASPAQNVAGVAGGKDKVSAIKAVLNGSHSNVLITDSDTAAELLFVNKEDLRESTSSALDAEQWCYSRAVLFSVDEQAGVAQRGSTTRTLLAWQHGLLIKLLTGSLFLTASKRFWQRPPIDPKEIAGISTTCMREASSCMTRTIWACTNVDARSVDEVKQLH